MNRKTILSLGVVLLVFLTGSCQTEESPLLPPSEANLPNPASEHCLSQGYRVEIITAADGSQSGECIFENGTSCDEWAYFRGECGPETEIAQTVGATSSEPILNPNPEAYQGWWRYTHPTYNFSLLLPEDWIIEEVHSSGMLAGHLLNAHPRDDQDGRNIRITYQLAGEDILLWPTGVGQGDFVPQGSIPIAGEPALRYLLVCPSGETTAIWYHQADGSPSITLGDLEFGLIYSAAPSHCEPSYSLGGKNQEVGELIISSLQLQ